MNKINLLKGTSCSTTSSNMSIKNRIESDDYGFIFIFTVSFFFLAYIH